MIPASQLAEATEWRRRIHMNPEVAFEEHETAAFIAGKLAEWGYEVETGIARTGVVGSLTKGAGNRAIGIRADIDALPISESSGAD